MNRSLLAALLLLAAPMAQAKTKILVEDPNNLVAGRYPITREQRVQATQQAESILNSLKEKDLEAAHSIRYVAVDAGPLVAAQAKREPESLQKTERRLGWYGIALPDNTEFRPIAIFDTEKHRIIHSRLYTVTKQPKFGEFNRFDDDIALYIGHSSPAENHFAK